LNTPISTCEWCENLATLIYKEKRYCHWHYPGMLNYAEKLPGIRHIYIRMGFERSLKQALEQLPQDGTLVIVSGDGYTEAREAQIVSRIKKLRQDVHVHFWRVPASGL
jgi:protein-L-isoaspartate O-methyltransferase